MARDISSRALECIQSGPNVVTKVTVTVRGGDPVELKTTPGWEAQRTLANAGTRGAVSSITFLPTDGVDDLFALVTSPGAVFDAFIGINLGTAVEYVQVFHGMAVDGSSQRVKRGVQMSLADPWAYYDRIKLFHAFKAAVGSSRAELIGSLFTMLDLGVSVVIEDDGGDVSRAAVFTDSRGQAAESLAKDGLLQVGFDGDGDLVIKAQHDVYHSLTPVWTFKSGNSGAFEDFGLYATEYPTIVAGTLERSRSLADALINSVKVSPSADWQTWKPQTANLGDRSDPRHQDFVGLRRVQLSSSTIDNACDALLLAKNELGRRLRDSAETARVVVAINPAVEEGDVLYLAAGPTIDDPGWSGAYIATDVTHSPNLGTTSIEAISAAAFDLEQAA